MNISDLITSIDSQSVGTEIYSLIEELFPICRSITGDGLRQTLHVLQKHIPLEISEVPTGTKVFDWTVPKEWNIRDAFIKNSKGERLVDFKKSNLHVLNYSIPIHRTVRLEELQEHLFSLPEHPDWIPYKTSYYRENWGFCLSHKDRLKLEEDEYEVCIDSNLEVGALTYGELYIKGQEENEVLISAHACHPSLANDNLSGVCLATVLAKHLNLTAPRYSYRFVFIPGTIGAITWLALNEGKVGKIRNGLVLTGVGDKGSLTYKRSRKSISEIDRSAAQVFSKFAIPDRIIDFSPYGYDERQYCSPGFNLSVGRLSRTPYGEYPQYHTSADNLEFVVPESLEESFKAVSYILYILENNRVYLNKYPKCEPQLGKRGLYESIGDKELAMLWVLNLSDGHHSLLDIAERSGLHFAKIHQASSLLSAAGLLKDYQRARKGDQLAVSSD